MPVKLLVVDDEPDLELLVRQRFRTQIRAGDYAVEFARSGVEALQKLAAMPDIDIVLTDINMPEMDGLTLLVKLQELDRLLKAVIVSAYGDMDNIRTAMHRGAADFLTKPIDFRDMELTVAKTLKELEALRHATREHDQLLALRHELQIASVIQQSILPRHFPPFPERTDLDVFAAMLPAREVGGDFYDFFLLDHDHLGVVVGDVSGKGVPAAIFMAMSRTLLKSSALQGMTPADCLGHVNALLCLDNAAEMFVTIFYGILDTRSGQLAYSNGGHNPPYVVRHGGTLERLPATGGMVLGVFDDVAYGNATATLEPGDAVFLYSDGITEAMDRADGLFSEARLCTVLNAAAARDPRSLVDHVVAAVQTHAGDVPQSDDITALCIRWPAAVRP